MTHVAGLRNSGDIWIAAAQPIVETVPLGGDDGRWLRCLRKTFHPGNTENTAS